MERNYITFNDGRIGFIKDICTCEKCKERNQAEMFINDLDNIYMDCIKTNDINDILYIGKSLSDAIESLNEYYKSIINTKELEKKYLQSIVNYYDSIIIKQ